MRNYLCGFTLAVALAGVAHAQGVERPSTPMKTSQQIFDRAFTSGQTIDSGILDVSAFECALVSVTNDGTAAQSLVIRLVRDDGTLHNLQGVSVAAGSGSIELSICPGAAISSRLPKRIQVYGDGAANTSVRLTIIAR